jgi:hypothetical protein
MWYKNKFRYMMSRWGLVEKVEKENVERGKRRKKIERGKRRKKKTEEENIEKKNLEEENAEMINIVLLLYDKCCALLV